MSVNLLAYFDNEALQRVCVSGWLDGCILIGRCGVGWSYEIAPRCRPALLTPAGEMSLGMSLECKANLAWDVGRTQHDRARLHVGRMQ